MVLSKNGIKTIRALQQKKFRQKYNKFIVEGDKIIRELIGQSALDVDTLYALPQWADQYQTLLRQSQINPVIVNDKELRLISQLQSPNAVLAIVNMPLSVEPPIYNQQWSIYLDGLQDPGNVGTILRIADWFGFPAVIAGPGCVDLYNSKVLQASMGAFLRVDWINQSLSEVRDVAPDVPIWIATMEGDNVFEQTIPKAGILCVGNEGNGVRPETTAIATQLISIPAPLQGSGAESLNVGVATGILSAIISQGRGGRFKM